VNADGPAFLVQPFEFHPFLDQFLSRLLSIGAGEVIRADEDVVEVVHVAEVFNVVFLSLGKETGIDEVEDNRAKVVGGPDSPGVENRSGHRTVALKREVLDAVEEFPACYMTALVESCPSVAERVVDEQVGLGLVPRVLGDDLAERVLHLPIVSCASPSASSGPISSPSHGSVTRSRKPAWDFGLWQFPASCAGRLALSLGAARAYA